MDRAKPRSHHAAMESDLLALVGLVFVIAGAVKGLSGMGLPTVSMALLGLLMPPASAAALMVLPSLATNVAQCLGPHARMLARRLWPMWAALAGAAVFSPLPDLGSAQGTAVLLLGGVLVAYGAWGLRRPALPPPGRHARWLGAAAGGLAGLLTAATGVFVMPMVPYLQSLALERDALIQALGLSFTVATLALAVRLGRIGIAATGPDAAACTVALAGAFAGLWLGSRLRGRLPAATFQRALYAVFVLLGAAILGRGLQS